MSSALLVPLHRPEDMTEELTNLLESQRDYENTLAKYEDYNMQCVEDLREMNENRIQNIIERGGMEGWETVSCSSYIIG